MKPESGKEYRRFLCIVGDHYTSCWNIPVQNLGPASWISLPRQEKSGPFTMTEFKCNLLPQVFSSLDQPKVRSVGLNKQVDPQTQKEECSGKLKETQFQLRTISESKVKPPNWSIFLWQVLNSLFFWLRILQISLKTHPSGLTNLEIKKVYISENISREQTKPR